MKLSKFRKNNWINVLVKLIQSFKKIFTSIEKTSFAKLCIGILNKKLQKLGILNTGQCAKNARISEKDFLKRKLIMIVKNKWKSLNFTEILKLIKQKKITYKDRPVNSPNIFLSKEFENRLKIII